MCEGDSITGGGGCNLGSLALLEAGRGSEQTLPEPPGELTLLTVVKPSSRGWLSDKPGLSPSGAQCVVI